MGWGRRPAGWGLGARVIVEKPFGRDLASARQLNWGPVEADTLISKHGSWHNPTPGRSTD